MNCKLTHNTWVVWSKTSKKTKQAKKGLSRVHRFPALVIIIHYIADFIFKGEGKVGGGLGGYQYVTFSWQKCVVGFFLPKFSLCIIATARSNELVFDNNNQHTARALKEERQPQRARLGRRWNCPRAPANLPLHNVLIGQYVFLSIEQAEIYLKIYVLIYRSIYFCPSLFSWKKNLIFKETVKFQH